VWSTAAVPVSRTGSESITSTIALSVSSEFIGTQPIQEKLSAIVIDRQSLQIEVLSSRLTQAAHALLPAGIAPARCALSLSIVASRFETGPPVFPRYPTPIADNRNYSALN
jgi:hypothetical protein